MDAEILFFMTSKDQFDFIKVAEEYCDAVIQNEQYFELSVVTCQLLLTPSLQDQNTLFAGKLEIRLSADLESSVADLERAKSTYRKLRNWIKKDYTSRLAYLNQKKQNKLTPSRNYWLGPNAKTWKEADQKNHILKLSESSWMVFELGY